MEAIARILSRYALAFTSGVEVNPGTVQRWSGSAG
jgi:hypothetical protein